MKRYAIAALLLGLLAALAACEKNHTGASSSMDEKKYNELTPEERRIIVGKGTEAPGSGEYDDFFEKGWYLCRRCDAPLYRSEDKFASGCGWPSFDDEIPGAVKRRPDPDGRRTEIICATCDGHLGHVFTDEGYTDKNLRHCVNSLSMRFVPAAEIGRAYFAGGCFWGVEYWFERKPGVIAVTSGFMAARRRTRPTRRSAPAARATWRWSEVTYEKTRVNFRDLAKLFFEIHDPAQADGQGPDIGEQYLSAIFYKDETEKAVALGLIGILRERGCDVATKLLPTSEFWPADDHHQDYYRKKGAQPYCHEYEKKFD